MRRRDFGGRGFGGPGPGGFGGPPFGPRRVGVPLVPQQPTGIGGLGLGNTVLSSLGLGSTGLSRSGTSGLSSISPLLTSLVAGGVGYFLGNRTAQGSQQDQSAQSTQAVQTAQPAQVAQPVQETYQQSYPYTGATTNLSQATSAGAGNDTLTKLQLLGELHQSGVLTDQEFEQQKQRILNG